MNRRKPGVLVSSHHPPPPPPDTDKVEGYGYLYVGIEDGQEEVGGLDFKEGGWVGGVGESLVCGLECGLVETTGNGPCR